MTAGLPALHSAVLAALHAALDRLAAPQHVELLVGLVLLARDSLPTPGAAAASYQRGDAHPVQPASSGRPASGQHWCPNAWAASHKCRTAAPSNTLKTLSSWHSLICCLAVLQSGPSHMLTSAHCWGRCPVYSCWPPRGSRLMSSSCFGRPAPMKHRTRHPGPGWIPLRIRCIAWPSVDAPSA
jgi:hypothetical protein